MTERWSSRIKRRWVTVLVLLAVPSVLAQPAPLGPQDRSVIEEHFRAAKSFEAAKEFAKAASEYKFILEKYPTAVPRVYHNLGLVSYYQREYEQAIEAFETGLKLDQSLIGSRLFLGIAYLDTERPGQAFPHLEAAHAQQPTFESALSLGQAYMGHLRYLYAIQSFREALPLAGERTADVLYLIAGSYLKLAERLVNAQTENYPESQHTHFAAARIFESQQGYQLAAIKYLEAAELDPMNASIFFPLARMLAILGLDAPSQLALERYWQLLPMVPHKPIDKEILPKEQVAEIGTKVDFEGILRALPSVKGDHLPPLPMVTGDVNEHLQKRLAIDSSGQWRSAVESLFEGRFKDGLSALDKITTTEDVWLRDYLKASAHVWLDDYDGAATIANGKSLAAKSIQSVRMLRAEILRQLSIEYFDRLVRESPDSCRTHLVKAMNLAAQEKAEAETEFQAAIEGCPFDTEIRIELADYYLWNSQYEEARQACLDELSFNPYSSAAKKRLGRIYVQLRQAQQGLPYLNAAAKADPNDPDVRTDLGRAYELLEEWQKAVAAYELALELDPTLNRIHYVLARIYRRQGKQDLAREQLRLFKENEESDRRARVERVQRLRQKEAAGSPEPRP